MGISKKDEAKKVSLTVERLAEFASFRTNLRLLRANTGLRLPLIRMVWFLIAAYEQGLPMVWHLKNKR